MKICGEAPFSSRDPARPRWLPESASENQEGTASVCEKTAILIMAASMRAGQSWDLRLPYASLRVTLRVGTQKQPTFMHLLTGLRLQHPPRGTPRGLCAWVPSAATTPVGLRRGLHDIPGLVPPSFWTGGINTAVAHCKHL